MTDSDPIPDLDVAASIEARRSTKDFLPDPIDSSCLEQILHLTTEAPSSWNLQPWRIIVVDDPDAREQLHEACFRQRQVLEAPVTIVFAVDVGAWQRDMGPIIEQARKAGAWPDSYCDIAQNAIPGGQGDLETSGRLREYAIKDAMIAATQCVLAATSFGLKTTFMNGWREQAVKDVIGASGRDEIAIAVLVVMGHAEQTLPHPGRLPRSETVFRQRLGDG